MYYYLKITKIAKQDIGHTLPGLMSLDFCCNILMQYFSIKFSTGNQNHRAPCGGSKYKRLK